MLELRNYGTASTEFRLGLIFDADFADMFEVRGSVRPRRGDRLPDEQGAAGPLPPSLWLRRGGAGAPFFFVPPPPFLRGPSGPRGGRPPPAGHPRVPPEK